MWEDRGVRHKGELTIFSPGPGKLPQFSPSSSQITSEIVCSQIWKTSEITDKFQKYTMAAISNSMQFMEQMMIKIYLV